MARAKKFIIGTLAAGIVAVATCIAASASTDSINLEIPCEGADAYFNYGAGFAEMHNTRRQLRWAGASVVVVDNTSGEDVDIAYDAKAINLDEYVSARVNGYSTNNYHFRCSGSIYAGGSHYTPSEYSITLRYPKQT